MSHAHLVTPEWLHTHLDDPQIVIVDCRFDLANPRAGQQQYAEQHIPGAVYMNLKTDLSGDVQQHGGRHPLPNLDTFCRTLGEKGIDRQKKVVTYDDQSGAMAARLWWMLTYLGHANVSLLNGGYAGWRKHNYPVTSERRAVDRTTFIPDVRREMVADMNDVKATIKTSATLIDARAPERFRGEEETLDKKAGHIPSAKNVFWKTNLNDAQQWKSPEALREIFSFVSEDEQPIVYCGSGVTACANAFALKRAGFDKIKLYVGSWSDWISYDDNPIEDGDE